MSKTILIFGATSCIAEAVSRLYACQGARLFLVARNTGKLAVVASNLYALGATEVKTFVMDANNLSKLPNMVSNAWDVFKNFDVALIAHGTLPDQARCEAEPDYAVTEFRTNAESIIACLTSLANQFERQGHGVIAVIGSVAGDRGRASNYVYGAAKAAVDAFASGLRGRLFRADVHLITIKPGFVDTPMTKRLPIPKILLASADRVAIDIVRAIEKKRDVLYTPSFWLIIMFVIMLIPNMLFKRIKL
jgi:hypothetical protein